jgi:hypothetical protein
MKNIFLILMIFSISFGSCVTKDRKCVKDHKKARKNNVGWKY